MTDTGSQDSCTYSAYRLSLISLVVPFSSYGDPTLWDSLYLFLNVIVSQLDSSLSRQAQGICRGRSNGRRGPGLMEGQLYLAHHRGSLFASVFLRLQTSDSINRHLWLPFQAASSIRPPFHKYVL